MQLKEHAPVSLLLTERPSDRYSSPDPSLAALAVAVLPPLTSPTGSVDAAGRCSVGNR